MRNLYRCWLAISIGIILAGILFIPFQSYSADAAAPTYLQFTFKYQVKNMSIKSGHLLLCDDANCAHSMKFSGNFSCEKIYCWASSSGPKDKELYSTQYHKIVIAFTDKTRESNPFIFQGGNAYYNVQVQNDALVVEEDNSIFLHPYMLLLFVVALILTLLVETMVAAIYTIANRIKKSFLFFVVTANIISLPVVWFVFRQIISNDIVFWSVSEPFAVVFEAAFMFFAGHIYGIEIKDALLLSFLMNMASFLVGLGVYYWLINFKW